ncbi:MAG: hypothetical protein ACTSPM_13255 [Candidatus Heimdallarchaeota archaeon]
MRIQTSSVSGFAKLAKFKENSKIVETPTIMKITKKSDAFFWEIGDGKDRFSLNLPPRYLSAEISMTEDYDW